MCCPCFLPLGGGDAVWCCASARVLGFVTVLRFLYHADGPLGRSFDQLFAAGAAEYAESVTSASGTVPVDVPIHPCVQEVIKREWKDPDKTILPQFMAKLYPLQDLAQVLPDPVPIDSFVGSLVGRTSFAEDAVFRDSVGKKVDVSLKKSYAGMHLALRAGIYEKLSCMISKP
ncbi:hypothetical protein NDU88_006493 [Pleurodeles waltl]|uniref:Uncharacterized protein n=1 Tax=Pleurodeles waltl TaxID=8319 RepID=A0AAV7VPX1_PLEWA|nr:hypothetical protein NDU88_006493 [Pleurodeles waltl]